MKRFCCLFIALAVLNLSIFSSAPLTRGTIVYIRMLSEVSSKASGSLDAVVDTDIKSSSGTVVIKKGTRVSGNLEVQKAKGVGKPGIILLKNLFTKSVDGQTIYLAGSVEEQGESMRNKALGLGLGLGLCLFLPCLAILAIKGGEAVIPAGNVYNQFSVADDYQIEIDK